MEVEPRPQICSLCGKNHAGFELSFAADFPDTYANLNKEDRDNRAVISTDQCIIDQDQFYIRGCIEFPIRSSDRIFLWGAWARVHEKDFDEIEKYWEFEGRENRIGLYKGRLANSLSIHFETLNMKLAIHIQPVGTRPLFVLLEREHPMAIEQESGLTLQKAEEYACLLYRMEKL